MFDLLPESRRTRNRSVWQAGTSIGVHALIITGAVWATRTDLVDAEAHTVVPVIMVPVDERTPDRLFGLRRSRQPLRPRFLRRPWSSFRIRPRRTARKPATEAQYDGSALDDSARVN